MCQVAVGRTGDLLRTTLGSCVGIGFLWREKGIYGLAHCLLPESPTSHQSISAKYVTDAVPSLLALMRIREPDRPQIEAVIAGGACMVQHKQPPRHGMIGEQNAEVAQRLVAAAGIRVIHVDVGGLSGRQLHIDCAQHRYLVKTIARSH
jgi:chemotaxis protein CheD